jgi:predicted phosphoribosyltransferase
MLAKVCEKMALFADRTAAGRKLVTLLKSHAGNPTVLVLALPRGGVPVAAEVARGLGAPLDILLVRKLGVPGHEELAMGAIAEGGVIVLNDDLIDELQIPSVHVDRIAARERAEMDRRARAFRGTRNPPEVAGRTVILIDDGLATGATMEAAARAMRKRNAGRVIIAVPVGARETVARLRSLADEVVVVSTPEPFTAVGLWYDAFPQMTDDEVVGHLSERSGRT